MFIYNCISDLLNGVVLKESINCHISSLENWLLQIGWNLQVNDLNSGIQMINIGDTKKTEGTNNLSNDNIIIHN